MKRAGGVLLALLALPMAALSQQASAGQSGTHLVSSGETLGSIAARYYGAPSEWPRIFEANRDLLTDPDVLAPGLSLRIPGDGAAAAAVVGVEVRGPAPAAQELPDPESRRDLLELSAFEPRAQPVIPLSERTVFFEFDAVGETLGTDSPTTEQSPSDLPPVVPEGVLREAGWIVPTGAPAGELGLVTEVLDGASVDGATVPSGLYGHVRIEARGEGAFQEGERYQTFSLGPPIEGLGRIAVPSGVIEVTETGGGTATAQVVELFGRLEIGQRFVALAPSGLVPGIFPSDADSELVGTIIALQQPAELYVPRVFAFADLGADAGLRVGDELVGVVDGTPEWSSEIAARFQVVGVREATSTLLLLSTTVPRAVRPGLALALDRSMP